MKDPNEAKEMLTIETFGEIMDEFLKTSHVQMLIDIPEGTIEPEITDNIGMGGVMQFYILLTAIVPIYKNMLIPLLDPAKKEDFIDSILGLLKEDLMEAAE